MPQPDLSTPPGATGLPDDVDAYHRAQAGDARLACDFLAAEIMRGLPEATGKVWHAHPVWFLGGNPIVGYAVRKHDVQLLFWSGQSFNEPDLRPEGTFRAAELRLRAPGEVRSDDLQRWLGKARRIQWDYKNIRRTRGNLQPIPPFAGEA